MSKEQSVLITGVAGFVGGYLVEFLQSLARSGEAALGLSGVVRHASPADESGAPLTGVSLHSADLADRAAVFEIVEKTKPDLVFHLAAMTSVASSWQDAAGTLTNNIVGQVNLLDALVEKSPAARVLIVGSAEEYGLVRPDELPVTESQPFRPNNPYAVSKISQDMLGLQYYLGRKLAVVRVRPFNHIGPRQRDSFVAAAFAKQVAEAEAGLIDPVIRVGNLEARREFTDVRDVVRAYWLALTLGEPGEVYNIASGRSIPIAELLRNYLGLSRKELRVEIDPSRLRPSDVPDMLGSAEKLRQATGWEPTIDILDTQKEILDHWRAQTASRA